MLRACSWREQWTSVQPDPRSSTSSCRSTTRRECSFRASAAYNGFGRLSGNETGSVGGTGAIGSRWGPTGLFRLLQTDMGGQISWLLPAALILLCASYWFSLRSPRTDRTRAAILLFGGWLVVTALVFSYARGIIHPYYNVALAPAIGAIVGIGTATMWRRRGHLRGRLLLAATLLVTAVWSYVLLARSPDWLPWLGPLVMAVGIVAALLLAAASHLPRKAAALLGIVAVSVAMAGPFAYALDTVNTPHSGAIPSAGPSVTSATPFGGGAPGGGPLGGSGSFTNVPAGGAPIGGFPGGAGGSSSGSGGPATGLNSGPAGGPGAGSAPGGGFLSISTPSRGLVMLLEKDARSYRWVAATVNSNSAAGYQLATGDPVMAIGGFNGTDPAPTLAEFERYVHEGKIHYFISGGGAGGFGTGGAGTSASRMTQWVSTHYDSRTIGGVTVFDLREPAARS